MLLNLKKCARILLQKQASITIIKYSIKSWNVVFFGSDNYSLHSLKRLHMKMRENVINNLEVVTVNDITPVYKYAVENNFKTHLWPPKLEGNFDIGIVVSFGKFIPNKIINFFPLGIINVHASLLPKYKGGMPIAHALKNGDKETGISIIKISSKIDGGDLILKKTIPIGENEMYPSLFKRLMISGANCLSEIIDGLPECLEKSEPQSEEKGSSAKIIRKNAREVKWSEMTAEEVYNFYRAMYDSFTLKTTWHGKNTRLICMSLNKTGEEFEENTQPGSVKYNKTNRCLIVRCKDKSIQLCSLQVKDKIYTAEKFYIGYICNISPSLSFFGT